PMSPGRRIAYRATPFESAGMLSTTYASRLSDTTQFAPLVHLPTTILFPIFFRNSGLPTVRSSTAFCALSENATAYQHPNCQSRPGLRYPLNGADIVGFAISMPPPAYPLATTP